MTPDRMHTLDRHLRTLDLHTRTSGCSHYFLHVKCRYFSPLYAALQKPQIISHDKVIQLLAHSGFIPKSDSICVPHGCEFNFEYLRSPGKSLCLGILSMGGGEARIENPLLPDQLGTTPCLPSCLLFSFGLELDTVNNYPNSDENLIRYTPDPSYPMVPFFSFLFNSHWPSRTFPARLDRTSPSFPRPGKL
jgi:hypothetical protein